MKTTLDLPEELVRQLERRAAREGRKPEQLAARLLVSGLSRADEAERQKATPLPRPVITKDPQSGLPVIQCRRAAPAGEELTPDRVAEILVEQETEWTRDPG